MTKRLAVIICFGFSLTASAAEREPRFRFQKEIEVGQPAGDEIIAVPLDSDVYAATRDGYPDLRIVDDRGAMVPYLLDPIGKNRVDQFRVACASKVVSLRVDEVKGLEIVVALDEKAPSAGGATIQSPLADYEHRVRVFGSHNGTDWTPLLSDGVIFDYSRFMDIRNRDLTFPANDYRQFKLVIERELDDRESPLRELIRSQEEGKKDQRVEITRNLRIPFRIDRVELWRTALKDAGTETEAIAYPTAGFEVEEDAKEKVSRIEIRSRREPLSSLAFATKGRNFSRSARVLIPVVRGVRTDWVEVGRGTVALIELRAFRRAELRVDFPEQRQEHYRLEIDNADNPPLEVTGVDALGTGYRLVFLRSEGRTYRVEYGSDTAESPRYDTAAVLASMNRGFHPLTGRLGPQISNPAYRTDRGLGASLDSPVFLALAIVTMVVVLAWALFRAGRHIKKLPEEEV